MILIDMEMPDSCINCPFSVIVNFGVVCCPTSTTIPDSKLFSDIGEPLERQGWCPLAELLPHGRLIDADAYESLLRGVGDRNYRREKGTICDAIKFLHPHYAPTIIPAEEVKES